MTLADTIELRMGETLTIIEIANRYTIVFVPGSKWRGTGYDVLRLILDPVWRDMFGGDPDDIFAVKALVAAGEFDEEKTE